MSRPKTPRDLAEQQSLVRVATLASHILIALRQPNRGVFDSERQLRGWLSDDGYEFGNNDLVPELLSSELAIS
jgi:hypothetical protein